MDSQIGQCMALLRHTWSRETWPHSIPHLAIGMLNAVDRKDTLSFYSPRGFDVQIPITQSWRLSGVCESTRHKSLRSGSCLHSSTCAPWSLMTSMSLSACGTILGLQPLLCSGLTSHAAGAQMRKSTQFGIWRHEKAPIYIFCLHLLSEFIPSPTVGVKKNNSWRNHLPKVFIVFHEVLPLLKSRMALWREEYSGDREPRPL